MRGVAPAGVSGGVPWMMRQKAGAITRGRQSFLGAGRLERGARREAHGAWREARDGGGASPKEGNP
ncbi:MAG: hypothetical protein GY859_09160 [Desulfobacterales bacterium]|nr:hypothetical protein [Desulfobacterales bacterium]